MKVVASILSLIGYFIGFWIFKSIFHSFLDGSTKIETVINGEWYIASGLTFIIMCVNGVLYKRDFESSAPIIILVATAIIATYIPYSMGWAILYNIIMIVCFLYPIWES